MKIYKYKLEFMEEIYFASKELGILYETNPVIGNYALSYAMKFCQAKYNQTSISYKEDFNMISENGIYITPAYIDTPKYITSTFNALSDKYNHKMDRAKLNYPQMGKIKALASGNIATGFIFCENDFVKQSYIRLGKFMGKAKVTYTQCSFNVIEDYKKECFGYINVVDLLEKFNVMSFEMLNMHPVPLMKKVRGQGELYEIKSNSEIYYYPVDLKLGGI